MRKDTTKKFLKRENRYVNRMTSLEIVDFLSRKKKKIACDMIDFINVLGTKSTYLNMKNILGSGDKTRERVSKNSKIVEFNMIFCERGSFTMEGDYLGYTNTSIESIDKPFLLGETEVTQELFECVLAYNTSYFHDENIYFKQRRQTRLGDTSKHPIDNVSWYDAIYFCNALSVLQGLKPYYEIDIDRIEKGVNFSYNITKMEVSMLGGNGYRLPYEKEWEYAAKAGTNNKYAGCDNKKYLSEYAWFGETQNEGTTHPVATKKPNEWGFYDMSGNVAEWCYDYVLNTNTQNVVRGGSYETKIDKKNQDSNELSTKIKGSKTTNLHNGSSGFRIARYV